LRVVGGVGAVTQDGARIPDSARIHRHISSFLAKAHSVHDGFGPRPSVPEPRYVVIREHAENGRAKSNRPQNLGAGGGEFLRVLLAYPVFVGEVHQQWYTGLDGGHHGGRTKGTDLDHTA